MLRQLPMFIFVLGVASIPACGPGGAADPLPNLKEVKSATAKYHHADLKKEVTFEVDQQHMKDIFSALEPAKRDRDPAKWQVLGDLVITKTDGTVFRVFMFNLSKHPGAFAAGPTWEERTYYRGGDSEKLKEALNKAFDASQKKKP